MKTVLGTLAFFCIMFLLGREAGKRHNEGKGAIGIWSGLLLLLVALLVLLLIYADGLEEALR